MIWLLVTLGAAVAAIVTEFLSTKVVLRYLRSRPLAYPMVQTARLPAGILLVAFVLTFSLEDAPLSELGLSRAHRGVTIAVTVGVAFLLMRLVTVFSNDFARRFDMSVEDNLRARTMQTQINIMRRIAIVVIGALAAASILSAFGSVRTLGTSLLASAGIVGIVAGVAARSSLGNLFAGIQIAFSAPIRLDDVVVVEKQWGRVEEITLSHVVVRTWDERRLILPCLYFVENPFENWTRPTSAVLSPIELSLDPCIDVDALRAEVDRQLAGHRLWDRRTKVVQVTDSGAASVTVRVLLSARNAGESFDLRCDMREGLLRYVREHQPDALPKVRVAPTA
jgi:small-conductance mechanosensitive channel